MNHKALITTLGTLMEAINATSQAHMRQIEGDQEAAAACLELAQDALSRGVTAYRLVAAMRDLTDSTFALNGCRTRAFKARACDGQAKRLRPRRRRIGGVTATCGRAAPDGRRMSSRVI